MGQVSAARQLPPHNMEATTPWAAYPWETLVPGDAGEGHSSDAGEGLA